MVERGSGPLLLIYHDVMTSLAPLDGGSDAPKYGGPGNVQRAWSRLAGHSEEVAAVLIDIAKNGASEPARVAAATQALKIVGLGNVVPIQVIPPQYDDAAAPGVNGRSSREVIESRLALLREPAYNPDDESGIVDAVIVEEDE